MIKWNETDKHEYFVTIKDRVFKLYKGRTGVLGIGSAYILKTKLLSETELVYVQSIVVRHDNHGLPIHEKIKERMTENNTSFFSEGLYMNLIFKIAEEYMETMFGVKR